MISFAGNFKKRCSRILGALVFSNNNIFSYFRLSVNAYIKLRSDMKQALITCRLAKHTVLATGLCNCLSPFTWKRSLQEDPSVALVASEEGQIRLTYGSSTSSADFLHEPSEPEIATITGGTEMLPPGKIIHIDCLQDDAVSMCFRNPNEFNQILVSAKMITDHMPASYQRMISRALQRFTHQITDDQQDLNPSV